MIECEFTVGLIEENINFNKVLNRLAYYDIDKINVRIVTYNYHDFKNTIYIFPDLQIRLHTSNEANSFIVFEDWTIIKYRKDLDCKFQDKLLNQENGKNIIKELYIFTLRKRNKMDEMHFINPKTEFRIVNSCK